jgi:hypothetical protein
MNGASSPVASQPSASSTTLSAGRLGGAIGGFPTAPSLYTSNPLAKPRLAARIAVPTKAAVLKPR